MNFIEYCSKFNTEKEALTQLHSDIYNAFIQNIKNISLPESAKGHKTILFKDMKIVQEDLSIYVQSIVNDIEYQHIVNESLSSFDIKTSSIDINQLLSGNLDWIPNNKTSFKPDYSLLTCVNDGQKYILSMNNWKMDFYNYSDFIYQKEKNKIKPFEYEKSLVHSTIDFPTGNLIAFNYLPREISDYIENNFKKSRQQFYGRNWDKFIGETLLAVNILRTPAYTGCSVLKNKNNVVIGNIKNTSSANSPLYVGDTEHDVWQTLVADKESLKKLISVALNKNEKQTQEYIDDIIFTQIAVGFRITPGTYNVYYYPIMNSDINEKKESLYGDFCKTHEFLNLVNPDMVITQEKIQPPFQLDQVTIISEEEKNNMNEKIKIKKRRSNELSL